MTAFEPTKPFNSLPPLPPAQSIETHKILKKCIGARVALADLKRVGELIPNQSVLINTIPLREAQDSSEIENIVTTGDKLFRHANTLENADPATKETLRYRAALFDGYQNIRKRPLSTTTAVHICQTIKNVELNVRNTPGTALYNEATEEIIYTPPEGSDLLRDKLGNWEEFMNNATDIDPLVRMAVGHYQFEAIHPFTDGNGRTGRILNILFLIDQGLLNIPVLYLSRHIIQNKDDYYRLLLEVSTHGQWEDWILYMLAAVEETAKWTTTKIDAIRALMNHTCEFVHKERPSIYSRELIELTFIHPYCRISDVTNAGISQRQAASNNLKALCAINVLSEVKIGREKLFINEKFLDLLMNEKTEFEPYQA